MKYIFNIVNGIPNLFVEVLCHSSYTDIFLEEMTMFDKSKININCRPLPLQNSTRLFKHFPT